jgi:elongator complex protein 4
MGCSLFIEESGTTDFGGSLLRYFAAEGVVQGHTIHLLGVGDTWGRELPGLSTEGRSPVKAEGPGLSDEKMKIAWRYERLGEFGAGPRGGHPFSVHKLLKKIEIGIIPRGSC